MSNQNSNSEDFSFDLKGESYGRMEVDRFARDRRVLVEVFNEFGSAGSAMVDFSGDDAIKVGEALIAAGRLAKED